MDFKLKQMEIEKGFEEFLIKFQHISQIAQADKSQ